MNDKKRDINHVFLVIETVIAIIFSLVVVNGVLFGLLGLGHAGFWIVPVSGLLVLAFFPAARIIMRWTVMFAIVFLYVFLKDEG